MTPPNVPNIPVDLILYLVIALSAYSAFRRGLLKESLTFIVYIPYIAALFYIFNDFVQNSLSFDSFLFKASALGGFYLAYLFLVWAIAKNLKKRFPITDLNVILLTKFTASFFGIAKTLYIILLSVIFFNIHVNNESMLEKSKLASALNPYALKIQDYILSKGYIENEITIYNQVPQGSFDELGRYEHPLIKKMKQSSQFKDLQKKLKGHESTKNIEKYLNDNF